VIVAAATVSNPQEPLIGFRTVPQINADDSDRRKSPGSFFLNLAHNCRAKGFVPFDMAGRLVDHFEPVDSFFYQKESSAFFDDGGYRKMSMLHFSRFSWWHFQ
jgi:hypothetical protein